MLTPMIKFSHIIQIALWICRYFGDGYQCFKLEDICCKNMNGSQEATTGPVKDTSTTAMV